MATQIEQHVVTSPWPLAPVPETDLTSYVLAGSERHPGRPALIDAPSGRTIRHGELTPMVRRVAAGLAARGFGEGDVLAIYAPNLPEYAVAAHAAMSLGGAVTTANPLYKQDELAYQLADSGARALLTVPPFLEPARGAAAKAGCDDLLVLGEARAPRHSAPSCSTETSPPRRRSTRTPPPRSCTRAARPGRPRASS